MIFFNLGRIRQVGEVIHYGRSQLKSREQNVGLDNALEKEGVEVLNKNDRIILNLCRENSLVIINTKFRHKNIYKYTREEVSRN